MDILPFWSLLGILLALCMDEIMGALQMDEGRAPPLQGRAEASWGLVPAHSMESTPPRGGGRFLIVLFVELWLEPRASLTQARQVLCHLAAPRSPF